jgi:heptosyltransferase III
MVGVDGENLSLNQRIHALRRRWMRRILDRFLGDGSSAPGLGDLPMTGIHRILVSRPNHRLGNTLLVGPLLSELERLYPGAEIDILSAGNAAHTVFSGYPMVRDITCLHQKMVRHLPATLATLRRIRKTRYDLVVDAGAGSQSGRLLLAWSRARFKLDCGASGPGVDLMRPAHMALRPVYVLRQAYAGDCGGPMPLMDMRLSEAELSKGRHIMQNVRGLAASRTDQFVIALFANATGSKRYGDIWWKRFEDAVVDRFPRATFVEVVAAHAASQLDSRYPTFYSRDLRKMSAVIAAADAFVSADCGVMHLAAASGARTFGLFSVTDRSKYAPYGNDSIAIDNRSGDPELAAHAVVAHLTGLAR